MTTPVTSDKTPTLTTEQRPGIRKRETAQAAQRPDATQETRQAETVREPDVERASRLFQTENGRVETASGSIQDEDEARSVLARLKEQFAENPAAALGAMGGAGEHSMQVLLQSPA